MKADPSSLPPRDVRPPRATPVFALVIPHLAGGGAERVNVNLANALVDRGYSVDMVLLSAKGEFLTELSPKVRIVDLDTQRFRWAVFPLTKYLRQSRPDAMIASMWPLTIAALWARWWARVPTRVVVAEHTTWSRAELLSRWMVGWQVRQTMHRFFPQADAIVTVSNGAADDLAQFANLERAAITVIYNPVSGVPKAGLSGELQPTQWWTGDHKRVLAVGTLKAVKDYDTLISAFAKVCAHTDARLLILGEGECRAALEQKVRALGIGDRVSMPGFVNDPSPYFARADVHVLSSVCEGFGNVIVEALSAGTPVVSTDCPSGPREILGDGRFGRLVPLRDAEAMAAAISESLAATHDIESLVRRAEYFSVDRAVDAYLGVLLGPSGGSLPQSQNNNKLLP